MSDQPRRRGVWGQPLQAGITIAFVGYTSSFAVVIAGLRAVGASPAQATSGLVAVAVATGLVTWWLTWRTRMPLTAAWSTPGAAVLVSTGAVDGGWPAAVGAFAVTGGLILLTGLWPLLGDLIARIPAPIAQATLGGVVLELCLAPVRAMATHPWEVAPILLTWLVLLRPFPRWAIPGAFMTTLAVLAVLAARDGGVDGPWLPHPEWTTPHLGWAAVVGLALPLYVVTMAGQNVPGAAIVASFGFRTPWRESMTVTGLGTLACAPLGGHAVNLAAISAAVPASAEAHPDPAERWRASAAYGGTAIVLGLLTTALTGLIAGAPVAVISTVAGLALLGTLGGSVATALSDPGERTAATVTFVIAASGTTIAGVGAAFWALVGGLVVRALLRPGATTG
ncbi:MAG: benzoate/H(+) symporter BenE family transporter [Nocardioides sp.]|uniref:benzoate/H(+) symporter BenE family transporter n=1 Tax=Nocardioides sp. TaxID=35761 RepID=UPI0039E3F73E